MTKLTDIARTSLLLLALGLPATQALAQGGDTAAMVEEQKGPHNGKLLQQGDFTIELAIFEADTPPEFRIWPTFKGQALDPSQVDIKVILHRLGDVQDKINFRQQDDFLRGDMVIYEPHSFAVELTANYQGREFRWQYDNFEGRTQIQPAMAKALEINTSVVGNQTLTDEVKAFGRLVTDPDLNRRISARFDGVLTKMMVSRGDWVKKGQPLAIIESNESLKPYTIKSPITGEVTARLKNPGEQTMGEPLLEIIDNRSLIAELAVFPKDQAKILKGQPVRLSVTGRDIKLDGRVQQIAPETMANQAKLVRVLVDNSDGQLATGAMVSAEILVDKFEVPLAVKRSGLQAFRDFTVVYAKFGDQYEVRMLDLGRTSGPWVEVLGGIKPGIPYVSENSYIIKADIEKSGASHDH